MNEIIFKRNELLARKIIKGLISRNMSGYYAENREAALKQALELGPGVRGQAGSLPAAPPGGNRGRVGFHRHGDRRP